jgi:hypothetical protein
MSGVPDGRGEPLGNGILYLVCRLAGLRRAGIQEPESGDCRRMPFGDGSLDAGVAKIGNDDHLWCTRCRPMQRSAEQGGDRRVRCERHAAGARRRCRARLCARQDDRAAAAASSPPPSQTLSTVSQ